MRNEERTIEWAGLSAAQQTQLIRMRSRPDGRAYCHNMTAGVLVRKGLARPVRYWNGKDPTTLELTESGRDLVNGRS